MCYVIISSTTTSHCVQTTIYYLHASLSKTAEEEWAKSRIGRTGKYLLSGHGHGHGHGIFILATNPKRTWTTNPNPLRSTIRSEIIDQIKAYSQALREWFEGDDIKNRMLHLKISTCQSFQKHQYVAGLNMHTIGRPSFIVIDSGLLYLVAVISTMAQEVDDVCACMWCPVLWWLSVFFLFTEYLICMLVMICIALPHVCHCVCMYPCMYVCMYVCIHVCTNAYLYVYVHVLCVVSPRYYSIYTSITRHIECTVPLNHQVLKVGSYWIRTCTHIHIIHAYHAHISSIYTYNIHINTWMHVHTYIYL